MTPAPSDPAAAAAENVPMLVPISQTGALLSDFSWATTAAMSSMRSLLMRKIAFIPCDLSEGASTTATAKPPAANISRVRTKKFPAPQFID